MDARGGTTGAGPDRATMCARTRRTADPDALADRQEALCFCGFTLLPSARVLLHEDEPVTIGSRAFDLLHLLVRSRGAIVERADIFRQVWPTTTVDESNLRFQVSCLRRALGNERHLLKTVPGRGYMLATEAETARPARLADEQRSNEASTAAASDEALQILTTLLSAMLEEVRAMSRGGRYPVASPLYSKVGQDTGHAPAIGRSQVAIPP